MIISQGMLDTLYGVHNGVNRGVTISRKDVNVLVDSLVEQICDHYFSRKPFGISNTRYLINKQLPSIVVAEDRGILSSLSSVLRQYDKVFNKSYTDHSTTFESFLNDELKELSKTLSRHSSFASNQTASNIRRL